MIVSLVERLALIGFDSHKLNKPYLLSHIFRSKCRKTLKYHIYKTFKFFSAFVVKGTSSKALHVSTGVPQGSMLGPLLFSLHISDFYQFTTKCQIHHYADDTQLIVLIQFSRC